MHGFTKGKSDADTFRGPAFDVVKFVFQTTVQVSKNLIMANVKVLTEIIQGMLPGHGILLSWLERKKGKSPQ
jgi:hypothetical protein